jgi:hypothetical protein
MKLELNENQLNIILQSLAKQPFEVVADIIAGIQNQYQKSKECHTLEKK